MSKPTIDINIKAIMPSDKFYTYPGCTGLRQVDYSVNWSIDYKHYEICTTGGSKIYIADINEFVTNLVKVVDEKVNPRQELLLKAVAAFNKVFEENKLITIDEMFEESEGPKLKLI